MLQTRKKGLVIGVTILIGIIVAITLYFTGAFGMDGWAYRLFLRKEKVKIEGVEQIYAIYHFAAKMDGKETVTISLAEDDKNKILETLKDCQFANYSKQVGLIIMGNYEVVLNDTMKFEFDSYREEEKQQYVKWYVNDKSFLTMIPNEIVKQIVDKMEIPLVARTKKYQTNKITIKQNENQIDIQEKWTIDYLVSQCKYVGEVEAREKGNKKYEIDFNNGIRLQIHEQVGLLTNLEAGSVAKNVIVPVSISDMVEGLINNQAKIKSGLFNTTKINIKKGEKEIKVTQKEKIEAITAMVKYGIIMHEGHDDWLDGEHKPTIGKNDTVITINENCIVTIPESKNDGNRFLFYKDGTVDWAQPIGNFEQYVENLLKD